MMSATVMAILNHATQLRFAHHSVRMNRKTKTSEATLLAFVLKPCRLSKQLP